MNSPHTMFSVEAEKKTPSNHYLAFSLLLFKMAQILLGAVLFTSRHLRVFPPSGVIMSSVILHWLHDVRDQGSALDTLHLKAAACLESTDLTPL